MMVRVKREPDSVLNRCLCCFQEISSESDLSFLGNVLETIDDCFSIPASSVVRPDTHSLCPSCSPRLLLAHRLKCNILNTLEKFNFFHVKGDVPPSQSDNDLENGSVAQNDSQHHQIRINNENDETNETHKEHQHCQIQIKNENDEETRLKFDTERINPRQFPTNSWLPDIRVNLMKIEHLNLNVPRRAFESMPFFVMPEDVVFIKSQEMKYFRMLLACNGDVPVAVRSLQTVTSNADATVSILPYDERQYVNNNLPRTVPSIPGKENNTDDAVLRVFRCPMCPKAFKTRYNLKRHTIIHSDVKNIKCPQCPKMFKCHPTLRLHMKCHSQERNYQCAHCSKLFKYRSAVIKHLRHYSDTADFKCDRCSQSFHDKFLFKEHMLVHNELRIFKCAHCPEAFKSNSRLKEHMIRHSEARNFVCAHCPKSFKHKICLIKHMKHHSGTAGLRCEHCDRPFYERHVLEEHMRIHSDVRSFKCTLCTKAFKSMRNLKAHTRTHVTLRSFKCTLCPTLFKSTYNLKRHMKRHAEA